MCAITWFVYELWVIMWHYDFVTTKWIENRENVLKEMESDNGESLRTVERWAAELLISLLTIYNKRLVTGDDMKSDKWINSFIFFVFRLHSTNQRQVTNKKMQVKWNRYYFFIVVLFICVLSFISFAVHFVTLNRFKWLKKIKWKAKQ